MAETQLTERSAYQQHFRDLCEALGVPHPTEEDLIGNSYTFEKHVTKVSDGKGFADVWKRDAFAFEYKGAGGDLKEAYKQLIASHEDLKTRTLTKLYNARPQWLANAHSTLDEAVFAAYGWPPTLTDQEILARLLALNHQRAAQQQATSS